MKITNIEMLPIRIPFKPEYVHQEGDYYRAEGVERVIIKVHTDKGIVGIGEDVSSNARTAQAMLQQISGLVLGKDPYELQEIHRVMRRLPDSTWYNSSRAAVDMALYDIMGKDRGLPLHMLIGGKSRTQLEDHRTVFTGEIGKRVEQALEYAKQGYKLLEVKGTPNIRQSFKEYKEIMDALGDNVTLICDGNAGWNDPKEVIREINEISRLHCNFAVEQPLPAFDFEGLAKITQSVEVPVVLDESVMAPEIVMLAVKRGAGDVFNLKPARLGGIFETLRTVAIVEAAGMPCYIGEGHETRLGSTLAAHLALHIRNLKWCGFFTHLYLQKDIVKSGGVRLKGILAEAPELPGLGIELDEDILKEFRYL